MRILKPHPYIKSISFTPADRVVEVDQGFDCIVQGRTFGTWATRELAKAGMRVEQDRANQRKASQ